MDDESMADDDMRPDAQGTPGSPAVSAEPSTDSPLADERSESDPFDAIVAAELAEEYGVDPQVIRAVHEIVQIEARWTGPLPPPNVLAGYEEVLPGAADRVFRLTESQVAHRQALEQAVIETSTTIERRAQWLAFIIMIVALGVGGWLIADDKNAWGVAVVFGTLAGIGGTFVYSRRQQREDLRERRHELDPPMDDDS